MENQKTTARCPKCGEEIWVGDEFCCNCGVSLVEAESVPKQKKKRTSKKRIAIAVGTIVAALCISVCIWIKLYASIRKSDIAEILTIILLAFGVLGVVFADILVIFQKRGRKQIIVCCIWGVLFLTTMFLWGQFAGGDYLFDIIKTYPDGAHAEYCAKICEYRGKDSNVTTPDHVLWFPVTEIGEDAFCYNSSIKQVVVSEGVTTIGDGAFWHRSLERIELPDGVIKIKSYAFANTDITSFEMPDSVSELGRGAFWNCDNLTSFTLSKNLDYLPSWTFEDCDALEEVIIPDNIKHIGRAAFAGCDNLKTVIIPEDTTYEADIIDESPNATIIQYTKNPF